MGNDPTKAAGKPDQEMQPAATGLSGGMTSPKSKSLQLSKEVFDFGLGENACPLNTAVNDDVTITNVSMRKLKFTFEPPPLKAVDFTFNPSTGVLSKGKSKDIKIRMMITTPINVNERGSVMLDNNEKVFFTVRARCDLGVFGVDPTSLDLVEDNGYRIPFILHSMRKALELCNAGRVEGIFRLAGDASEIKRLKEEMNKGKWTGHGDVNSIANLLKIWYRELPVPILNCLPTNVVEKASDTQVCTNALSLIPEPQISLFSWLLDLMMEVSSNSAVNKMTAQNLAIVIAPNLYDPPGSDPMESLILSQKGVQYVHNILVERINNPQATSRSSARLSLSPARLSLSPSSGSLGRASNKGDIVTQIPSPSSSPITEKTGVSQSPVSSPTEQRRQSQRRSRKSLTREQVDAIQQGSSASPKQTTEEPQQ